MAGTDLHRQIILHTKTDGSDQDHIDVVHLSYASRISDRTEYLLGSTADNPGPAMAAVIMQGMQALKNRDQKAAAGVPCNTFHAPEIFNPFKETLLAEDSDIQIVHMLEETASYILNILPKAKRIGLLSTTGTRSSRVWHHQLAQYGIEIIEVPEELQPRLHENIYHPKWGIKAISKASERVKLDFDGFCQMLLEEQADGIILGCTELPLIFPIDTFLGVPLIDPMVPLARALIREASPSQLMELKIHF